MPTFRTSRPGSAADPSRPHLVLVGLPGSGKSTVGAIVAERLGRPFLDFDIEISRREGMTVAEIFAVLGEPRFRELERELTEEAALVGNMVLAPGGGWMTQADTVAAIRPNATLVYLRIAPETALDRIGGATVGRPLLMRPDPRGELTRLLAARRAAYESADMEVDVEGLGAERVAERILALLRT